MSRVYLDRAIFTTITVMSVRIVYDGGQNLKLGVRRWDNPQPSARHVHLACLLGILLRRAELNRRADGSEQMNIIRTESRLPILAAQHLRF